VARSEARSYAAPVVAAQQRPEALPDVARSAVLAEKQTLAPTEQRAVEQQQQLGAAVELDAVALQPMAAALRLLAQVSPRAALPR
jgi:hypothetical protein